MWKESYDVKRIKKTGKLKQQYGCNEHCVKSVRIRSCSGPYFPAFGLNTDQNNYEYGHFLRGESYQENFWTICEFKDSLGWIISITPIP